MITVKLCLSQREIAHRREVNEQINTYLAHGMTWAEIASQCGVPKSTIHALYTYQKIPTSNEYRRALGFPTIGARRYYPKNK